MNTLCMELCNFLLIASEFHCDITLSRKIHCEFHDSQSVLIVFVHLKRDLSGKCDRIFSFRMKGQQLKFPVIFSSNFSSELFYNPLILSANLPTP